MIAVGIATGGLLTFGEIAMFCGWQAGMNLVLGFTLPRTVGGLGAQAPLALPARPGIR